MRHAIVWTILGILVALAAGAWVVLAEPQLFAPTASEATSSAPGLIPFGWAGGTVKSMPTQVTVALGEPERDVLPVEVEAPEPLALGPTTGTSLDPGPAVQRPAEDLRQAELRHWRQPVPEFSYAFTDRYTLAVDASESRDRDGTVQHYLWQVSGVGGFEGMRTEIALPRDGTYNVTLTITDDDERRARATLVFDIRAPYRHHNLDPEPIAGLEADGARITFDARTSSDPDGDTLTYRWYVDGQEVSTEPTFDRYFANNGRYKVSLLATDPYGGSTVVTRTLDVDILEAPQIVVDMWSGAFLDEPVFLDASSSWSRDASPLTFHWTVDEYPHLESREPLLIFQPPEAGELTVRLTVTAESGLSSEYVDRLHVIDWQELAVPPRDDGDVDVSVQAADVEGAEERGAPAAPLGLLLAALGAAAASRRRSRD